MDNCQIPNIPSVYWMAISNNDSSFDNKFYYGVKTTKIFCRPSCKSRIPNKNNVYIFKEAQSALEFGFRPCKRCQPDNLLLPNEEWIKLICDWINENFQDDMTLNSLSETFHSSQFHLQRTFNKVKGESPLSYLKKIRLTTAADKLKNTDYPIQVISSEVGFQNSAYFSTAFKKHYNVAPKNYRKQFR
ncbi:methylphosphotriester-DNA--protein-cysteine methyltransferase family protein [Salipaludibacillus agaradhaerens]|jgi:AraC family transcriptional regulator of adaptative response / methylphosphotriester-DNA alkyltransferase methyltransferase|uniref:bifunctional transcriptional activator/DNA repair enzyme AdaA n=1 Tax=Salipaludibacillus agaradhaerens TaxID=76935 RepID=UPI002151A734|nr:Ada metal-binding domain-containing protein [Salipaludibacillus agaradhaerens]MCR6106804.1 methylphosphotriester-DNA--protein-cysteine methyltransferase family protein [Salipaludibacillus agaradhaerens]MCR6118836.1 methylphosphotriester-DNA--protein-cysteine methyltransferase family protein [Salipaludibacillus agaradhaerens]